MLYEFKCKKCGNVFEESRALKDNSEIAVCPKCKYIAKKIVSTFGFKVNGFSQLNGYSSGNI